MPVHNGGMGDQEGGEGVMVMGGGRSKGGGGSVGRDIIASGVGVI